MKKTVVFVLGGVLLLAAVVTGGYLWSQRGPLPRGIQRQINFSVYYPRDTKAYPVDVKSIHYDNSAKVLGYTAHVAGTVLVMNQQSEPEVFSQAGSDIALYQKLLDKMHQYQDFDTDVGTVTLTHPDELKGGQAAVLDEKGTLLFAQPSSDLTPYQWKAFFDNLKIVAQ